MQSSREITFKVFLIVNGEQKLVVKNEELFEQIAKDLELVYVEFEENYIQ